MEDTASVEETRQRANEREAELKRGDERRTAQLHQENRALWADHFQQMSSNHAKLAEEYRERAETLMSRKGAA